MSYKRKKIVQEEAHETIGGARQAMKETAAFYFNASTSCSNTRALARATEKTASSLFFLGHSHTEQG